MSISSSWNQILGRFEDKEYRDLFVAEQIYSRLPLKIRALRDERHLTQKKLGEMASMKQTWISKLEDPNYGKLTIPTLLKIASAFDVALYVDFVPFSDVLKRTLYLSPESFSVSSWSADSGLAPVPMGRDYQLTEAPLPPRAGNDNGKILDISTSRQFQSHQSQRKILDEKRSALEGGALNGTFGNYSR